MMSSQVEQALRAIADLNHGRLTPRDVVKAARSKDSPLHTHFTWDVKAAAQKCLEEEARALIRSVKIVVTTAAFTTYAPAFVRDPVAVPLQGYVSIGKLQTDADLARQALVAEFARATAALARAKAIALAVDLAHEIEEVHNRVVRLSDQAQEEMAEA